MQSQRTEAFPVNQYETIGVVLGIVLFGVILLACILVGRKEHA